MADILDEVLKQISDNGGWQSFSKSDTGETRAAIHKLKAFALIRQRPNSQTYDLTDLGYKAVITGVREVLGVKNHVKNPKEIILTYIQQSAEYPYCNLNPLLQDLALPRAKLIALLQLLESKDKLLESDRKWHSYYHVAAGIEKRIDQVKFNFRLTPEGEKFVATVYSNETVNSSEEVNHDLGKKIDDLKVFIVEELKKNSQWTQAGQEVLFNELNEIRKHSTTLDNKNWKQLIKGKLIDLGLDQVINIDNARYIFNQLTDEILKLGQ